MPIHIQTGLPGSAKTLRLITYVKALSERENRHVYYHGINDLQLSWTKLDDPKLWYDLPEGSIIFIDECQDLFPVHDTKLASQEYVLQLAKHRHKGYDLFLITQHPMNIHAFVRRLTDKHWHNIRAFGMQASNVHEWNRVIDYPEKNKKDGITTIFKFPKESFKFYKSAEVHTIQRKIPKRIIWLLVIPFLLAGFGYVAYTKLNPAHTRDLMKTNDPSLKNGTAADATYKASMPKLDYFESHQPRVADLPSTAPVYDEITKPSVAPVPAACVLFRNKCTCYSQQATHLQTSDSVCRQIVAGGYFQDFNVNPKQSERELSTSPIGVSGRSHDVDSNADDSINVGARVSMIKS